MMKKRFLLSFMMVASMAVTQLQAIPANPVPRVVTQPDGTTITVSMRAMSTSIT